MTITDTHTPTRDLDPDLLDDLRRPGGPAIVTATSTRPHEADAAGIATIGRRPNRPDGIFARPEVLAARSSAQAPPPRRSNRPASSTYRRLVCVLQALRLPPPLVETSHTPAQTRLESAAAIGASMRRRDDPNP